MSTNTANLLLKDLVVETRLELSLASRGSCDIHGGLTTTEDNEILLWGDRSRVEWGIGDVGLHDLKVGGVDDLGGAVLGRGNAVGAVWGPLDICDLLALLVNHDVVKLLSGLFFVSIALSFSASAFRLTVASYWETDPSSCPAIMYLDI